MNRIHRLAVGVVLLCLMPASGRAEGNIHVGQLKIDPYIGISESFTDNVYYTPTDKKVDSFTMLTPGVKLRYPFRLHRADFEYYGIATRYHQYKEENTTDHHVSGMVDLKFGGLFGLKISDRYAKDHEGRGQSSTGFIEIYRTNTFAVSGTYQLADLSKVQLDYLKSSWRFDTSTFRDRDEDQLSLFFHYRFMPKTSAFIEYDRIAIGFTDPAANMDNTVSNILGGIRWEMTAQSQGTAKIGWTSKDFKAQEDFSGWIGSLDMKHDFTESTSMLVVGSRSVNETSIYGNRYFITTGIYAKLTHRFLRKLSAFAQGSYGEDLYADPIPPDPARHDRTVFAGLGVRYVMQDWIEFGLDHGARDRTSNIPANDYVERSTMLTANMSF